MIKEVCVTEIPQHIKKKKKMCLDLIKLATKYNKTLQEKKRKKNTHLGVFFSHSGGVQMVESGSCILPREHGDQILSPPAFNYRRQDRSGLEVGVWGNCSSNGQSKNAFTHLFYSFIHSLTRSLNIYLPIFQALCEGWEHTIKMTSALSWCSWYPKRDGE